MPRDAVLQWMLGFKYLRQESHVFGTDGLSVWSVKFTQKVMTRFSWDFQEILRLPQIKKYYILRSRNCFEHSYLCTSCYCASDPWVLRRCALYECFNNVLDQIRVLSVKVHAFNTQCNHSTCYSACFRPSYLKSLTVLASSTITEHESIEQENEYKLIQIPLMVHCLTQSCAKLFCGCGCWNQYWFLCFANY